MRYDLLVLAALLAVPATAGAASSQTIYDDCQDNGRLDKTYTSSEYRKALKDLPEDLDEYTDCADLIRSGLAGVNSTSNDPGNPSGQSSGGGGGTTGGGGSAPQDLPQGNGVGSVPLGPEGKPLNPEIDAQPEEKADLGAARAGENIVPTSAGVRPGEPDSELPGPLVAVLILAGLAAVTAGALGVKQLVTGPDATA